MVDCPSCGSEMVEAIIRYKLAHRFGKAKNTVKQKSRLGDCWHCGKCDKYFRPCLVLTEVERTDVGNS